MFQTGSQINPALGRIDYSTYAQGAIAGGQAIGQGIANLGQGIASGIEQYVKKKEENKKLDDATSVVSNLVKSDPKIAAFFNLTPNESGEYDVKAIRSAVKTVGAGPILQLAQQNQEFNRTQENESRTAQAGLAFSGSGMGPVLPANRAAVLQSRGFTPQQIAAGQAYALNLQAKQADIDKTNAEIAAAGVVKEPDLSFQEQQLKEQVNAFVQQTGKRPTYAEKAQIMANIARGAGPQPPNPYEARVADQLFMLDQVAKAAPQQIENIDEQIKLLDEGKVNIGFLGQIEQGIGQIRSLLGDKEAAKAVTNTQVLESALGADLIGQIKSAGLTTRSFDTPKEMENLRAALVGSTKLEPATLKKIAELRKKNLKLVIDDYNRKVKGGAYERMYSLYNEPPSEITLDAPINLSPAALQFIPRR